MIRSRLVVRTFAAIAVAGALAAKVRTTRRDRIMGLLLG